MKYATPELIVVGAAAGLVRGVPDKQGDNGTSEISQPLAGVALGLDD